MTRISNFWIIFVAVTVSELSSSVSGQSPLPALVPTRMVNAKSGQPANFSCESQGIPLSLCLWETIVPEGSTATKTFLTITSASKAGQSVQPGYNYNGEGLEKGQCGITIESVRDKDNGNWQCTLISSTGTYRGTVNLGILRKPDAPGFNVQPTQLSDLVEDDPNRPGPSRAETTVTCYSSKGEPKPTFQWFIDEEPITDNLGPVNETTSGGNTFTFQELRNYRFTHKDNGRKLRCVLVHDALTDADKKEVTKDIVVQYRPRSADDGRETGRLPVRAELGEEKLISMNVSANPRPSNIQWTIDGKSLRENENSGNYEALPLKEVGPGVYETTLKIKEVEEEDLNKKIALKVENVYGVAEFAINISSSTAGSGGLNAGGILGIIIAVIAIIVLVAVIVVFARAKGLLCFKGDDGTASEKERMDGGSTGAGGAEEKPTLSSRLSAFYENLLAKKKDKTAPVDEEAGKDKETKEKDAAGEGGEGVAAASGDDKEKKPDDIVYAELDLARTGGTEQKPEVVVRGVDDKTEYAEIVGVAPQAKTVDETSPKKSPKGSPKN